VILSRKCQYAMRAMYEITLREGDWPVKSAEIAEAQAIPPRFLENILAQLKQGGFVASKRGREGGYMLPDRERDVTVGEVIRFVQGPLVPVYCMTERGEGRCPFERNCPFHAMWERARDALAEVYDNTTFRDLIREREQEQD